MGGKDVVCVKQLKGSSLTQSDVQARLKKLADDKFSHDGAGDDRLAAAHGLNVSVLSAPACTSFQRIEFGEFIPAPACETNELTRSSCAAGKFRPRISCLAVVQITRRVPQGCKRCFADRFY